MMVLRGGGLEVAALRSDGQEFNCSSRVSLLHVRELHVAATWRRWGYHGKVNTNFEMQYGQLVPE